MSTSFTRFIRLLTAAPVMALPLAMPGTAWSQEQPVAADPSCDGDAPCDSGQAGQGQRDLGGSQQPTGPITVVATRSPSAVLTYPGAVTVVERSVIDDFNASSLSDIFQAIPGARFDGGPRRAGAVPTVRGLSGAGVLIFVDGARQSFLSGHDGRLFVDPELLRSVEVVRGPTSALYGSGALGGVISLQTITAQDFLAEGQRVGGRLNAGFRGVNNEFNWGGTTAIQSRDGQFDFLGNATFRTSSDISLGSGLTLPVDDDVFTSLAKATFRPSDSLTVSAQWVNFDGNSRDPNNPQGATLAGPGNEEVLRRARGDTLQAMLAYAPGSQLIDLDLTAFYSRNTVSEDVVGSPRVISRAVETTGITMVNRSAFSLSDMLGLRFTYGGEYYEDQQTGRDNGTADGTRGGVPDATQSFYGWFAQAELDWQGPLGRFILIPGVRWDRFENRATGEADAEDDAFSPKIGLSWQPVPQLTLFGNWAQAFRAPSFNEVYADGVHFQIPDLGSAGMGPPRFVSNLFVSNPDLQPEQSDTFEFGAALQFSDLVRSGDFFSLRGSYYQSDVENLIGLEVNIPVGCFGAPFPPCGSGVAFGNFSRNVNFVDARIDGVEVEASYDSDLFYARANFSAIDGRDRATGDFVGTLTPDTFFIDAGVRIAPLDVRLGGRLTVAGRFDEIDDPLQFRDGYETGDVYLVWEPDTGPLAGFRVDLGIDNVADADFEVVAAGVSQPGRSVKAALTWRGGF